MDLEGIARHKGSAFGALGESAQPTQEMFENILGLELHNVTSPMQDNECVWLEDESRRIGLVNIPGALWDTMRQSPLYFLEVPFEERLAYITESYGKYEQKELVNSVMRIQKRLGGLDTKNAINFLLEKNYKEAFRILLSYYDKYYERSLESRDNLSRLLTTVVCGNMDILTNSKKLVD